MQGKVSIAGMLKTRKFRTPRRRYYWNKVKRFWWVLTRRVSGAWWVLTVGATVMSSTLRLRHYIAAEDRWVDHGIVSRRVVTTEFINMLCDALADASAARLDDFKFHGSGTDNTPAPAIGDTALQAQVESRATGTQVDGGTTYQSIGEVDYTATRTIVEHGLFSAASGSDELMDRHIFDGISVVSGDSIEFDYTLTFTGS